MKRTLAFVFAAIGWFAVIAQYYLMIKNTTVSVTETTIRFFSFFTILTNTLVAFYFTLQAIIQTPRLFSKPGSLTAITLYITIVGLVYQIVLRPLWSPTGLQKMVDELLHSVTPVLVIIYWYLYESKAAVRFGQIPHWLLYPFSYLVYILIRGNFSGFYPYPFVNVATLGMSKVLINSLGLLLVFTVVAALLVGGCRLLQRKQ